MIIAQALNADSRKNISLMVTNQFGYVRNFSQHQLGSALPSSFDMTSPFNSLELFAHKLSGSGAFEIPNFSHKQKSIQEPLTTQEMIEHLRRAGFPLSHLAAILRVSRPSVYHWQDGGESNFESQKRLQDIHDLIFFLSEDDAKFLHKVWLRELAGDKSLYQLLCEEQLDSRQIRQALAMSEPLIQKIKQREANKKPLTELVAEMKEMGTPFALGWDEIPAIGDDL